MTRPPIRLLTALLVLAVVASACGDDDAGVAADGAPEPVTLTMLTHDSFDLSDHVLSTFTAGTGIEVRLLASGDAGSMVNQAILTKDAPQADVLFGIDNTFLSRALDEDLFVPYTSGSLDRVDPALVLDPDHRVTPIDTGDVCLNYDKAAFVDLGLAPPTSLDDLIDPAYDGLLVVENPATSSPGLAFLLATIDAYGEEGWQDWWSALAANDVEVAAGWEEAYYGSFTRSGGDQPIVVSYASSPPAEVIFAEEPLDEAPTGVVEASCFRQIEFAGVLAGTEHPDEAGRLIDFMLSDVFQADIPGTMFVYPVTDVALPSAFVAHGVRPSDPYQIDPATIAANRDEWIAAWTDLVLR